MVSTSERNQAPPLPPDSPGPEPPPGGRDAPNWWRDPLLLMPLLTAQVALWTITRAGMRRHLDSNVYLGAVANLLDGRGLSTPFASRMYPIDVAQSFAELPAIPLRLYPPGYPLSLTFTRLLGAGPLESARVLNAVWLAALVVIAFAVVRWGTRSRAAALAAAMLIALAPPVLASAAQVMSDLQATALAVVALGATARCLADGITRGRVAVVWLTSAAVVLTRFAGISVAIAVGVAVLLSAGPITERLRRSALLTAPAAGAALLWQLEVRQGGDAPISYHPDWAGAWSDARDAVSGWWLHRDLPPHAATVGAIALVIAVVLLDAGRTTSARVAAFRRITYAYVACHLGVVAVSKTFVGYRIPFNTRMLLPVFVMLVLLVVVSVTDRMQQATDARRRPMAWGAVSAALTLALLAVNPWRPALAWDDFHAGSTAAAMAGGLRDRDDDPLLADIAALPDATVMFSTQPEAVWAETGRPVLALPMQREPATGRRNPHYERDIAAVQRIARSVRNSAFVLYWAPGMFERYLPLIDPCATVRVGDSYLLVRGPACRAFTRAG